MIERKTITHADPGRQYRHLQSELDEALQRVLDSGQYIGGQEVSALEHELSAYLSIPHGTVATCANGTDALGLAYETIELMPGDEIIMPSMNYVASAEAAVRRGLVPVWADVHPSGPYSYTIESDEVYLRSLLSPRTRAIVGVNLYGHAIDAGRLGAFAERHNLTLIEDNAQGMGGRDHTGRPMGRLGAIGTTSFFPTKPLGCMGDGGAIVSTRTDWIARARELANHGQTAKYDYHRVGTNSRLDTLQATILRVKLRHLDELTRTARAIAHTYTEALEPLGVVCPPRALLECATWHQYTILLPEGVDRTALISAMTEAGIPLRLYYPEPLHATSLYRELGVLRGALPHTETIARHMLQLPIYPLMRHEEAQYVLHHLIAQL